jgi:hypothetical protein
MTGPKEDQVPREQGGIESERAGKDLAEHGRSGEAGRARREEVERELGATHDEARRQWRGSTPDERTMEKALEVREGEDEG